MVDTCRSELARDGCKGAAFSQAARIIVNVHREQARSYKVIHRVCQVSQYQRSSPGGRFLKRFMLHMYWLG
ncbi:UNVERIFIED_ORG: hypothetical protein J2Y84_005874 [Pseudomonas reinekei]|nr:hypothetical protein [Pseudomonas reinekei]MDF9904269.1 hypothetical protein [Pseudomonas reinekei]